MAEYSVAMLIIMLIVIGAQRQPGNNNRPPSSKTIDRDGHSDNMTSLSCVADRYQVFKVLKLHLERMSC